MIIFLGDKNFEKKTNSNSLKDILDWRTSREYFYWRLKRRLAENEILKAILTENSVLDYEKASNYLQQWFNEDKLDDVRKTKCKFNRFISLVCRRHNGLMIKQLLVGLNK